MNARTLNYKNLFEAEVPAHWSRQTISDNNLLLLKSPKELLLIRIDYVKNLGPAGLEGYMCLLRDNPGKVAKVTGVGTSDVEPYATPHCDGKIMTYSLTLNGVATEITLFAFQNEYRFYVLMLQTPASSPPQTLSEFFDIVNSFRIPQ